MNYCLLKLTQLVRLLVLVDKLDKNHVTRLAINDGCRIGNVHL